MAKYFDSKGFFIADSLFSDTQPFIFVLGGRGIGKTFSATRWLCNNCDSDHKFVFMRRTDNEIKFINEGNIYAEHSPNVHINRLNKVVTVERCEDGEETGEIIGYHLALSTIHNIRGFAMLDVDYILFDEFIAERGTVVRKFAGEQMLNAYETINRNRELLGRNPVKCVFLSNYNTSESDIMLSFGYTDELFRLQESRPLGIEQDEFKKLIMINETPITEKKARTALYQVAQDEEFTKMAIENNGYKELMPLKHYGRNSYDFVGTLGEININRLHSGFWYITQSNNPQDNLNRKNLLHYLGVYQAHLLGNVYTNSHYIAQLFVQYYTKK